MPLYEFKCCNCGWEVETIVALGVLPKKHEHIKVPGVVCSKCGEKYFDKQISMHGKTVLNWASWQDKPSVPKTSKKSGPKKPKDSKK